MVAKTEANDDDNNHKTFVPKKKKNNSTGNGFVAEYWEIIRLGLVVKRADAISAHAITTVRQLPAVLVVVVVVGGII